VGDWIHILHKYTHKEFAELAALYEDVTGPPCMDVSSAVLLRPSQIQHYMYGGWQGTLEVQECLEGIFKLLLLNPPVSLLQQPESDQILIMGEALTKWTRIRHFSNPEGFWTPHIHTAFGPWHDGAEQFLTFYLCKDYWSLLDPM